MSAVNPCRLVTLLELLELRAEPFWRLSNLTGQLLVRLETNIPEIGEVAGILYELRREAERFGARSAVAQIDRISSFVRSDQWNRDLALLGSTLHQYVKDLHYRMIDDLEGQFFLSVPLGSVSYYSQETPLFGDKVEARFPLMSEDIAEAGKCLALSRSTASVFHLMRVLELAVQEFGTMLGVTLAAELNWQVILDQINKAIRNMNHKDARTKAYAEAASHLYNVKVAWRNEVMHPKQTYTAEEASVIFAATKTFVADLAETI